MSKRQTNLVQFAAVDVRLGEAAIEHSVWRNLLEEMCRTVSATGASLRQTGIHTPDAPYTRSMEELTKVYFREGWHLRDTRVKKLLSVPLHAPVFQDFDIISDGEMKGLILRDAHFNDFLGIGKLKSGAWIQSRSEGNPWLIAFQMTDRQGPFGRADIRPLQLFSRAWTETADLSAAVRRTRASRVNLLRSSAASDCWVNVVNQTDDEPEPPSLLECSTRGGRPRGHWLDEATFEGRSFPLQ